MKVFSYSEYDFLQICAFMCQWNFLLLLNSLLFTVEGALFLCIYSNIYIWTSYYASNWQGGKKSETLYVNIE